MAYANVVAVRHDLERDIADPDTYNENRESLDKQLKIVKREQPELKKRILNHFTPSPPKLGSKGELSTPRVDHGAKSKVENRICRSPMKDRAAKAIEYPSIASLAG
ncbi:hypothetical protein [Haloferula sp.]|uniref:hypothetical protein n=1 Tax=Haloferula sp. TaxID=2497595 RepID=UPI00329AE5EE